MTFESTLRRVLRPLVRLAIARRFGFPAFAELLKSVYVEVAESRFTLEGKRLTDSRVSLLTGLQRRDVRALRWTEPDRRPEAGSAGPLPRVVARWIGARGWQDRKGQPLPLPRRGKRSFESLVAEVSRDVHARTVLDELLAQGTVTFDADREEVRLAAEAFLPRDEAARLAYFGANLGDHGEAATANLLAEAPPFFERAVHYNGLSAESLQALDSEARQLLADVLAKLNAEALRLQEQDTERSDAGGRFRVGAFIYAEKPEPTVGENS